MCLKLTATAIFLPVAFFSLDDEILLRNVYRENTRYRTKMDCVVENMSNLEGDEALLDRLRSAGAIFPLQLHYEATTVLLIETAMKTPSGEIPFTGTGRFDGGVTTAYVNGQIKTMEKPSPRDNCVRFWGSYSVGKTNIDSVQVSAFDSAQTDSLKEAMSRWMWSVDFPDSPLRVGESFTQTESRLFNTPGVMTGEVSATVTYTLRQFDAKLARFDLVYNLRMPETIVGNTVTNGSGQMTYDRELGQVTRWITRFVFDSKKSLEESNMPDVNVRNRTDIEYEFIVTAD